LNVTASTVKQKTMRQWASMKPAQYFSIEIIRRSWYSTYRTSRPLTCANVVFSASIRRSMSNSSSSWQTRTGNLPRTKSSADTPATSPGGGLYGRTGSFTASMTPQQAIFPWRHEEEKLPRLIPGTLEHFEQGGALGPGFPFQLPPLLKFVLGTIAATRLNIPWFHQLIGGWKEELADSSAWAFSQGVSAVLSNTYAIPFDDIISQSEENEDGSIHGGVNFGYTTTARTPENTMNSENAAAGEECPEVEYMMEENLRKLYQSAHDSGKDQMQIVLQTKPVAASLQSIVWIPFLSRSLVEQRPELRQSFLNLAEELERHEKELGRPITQFEAMKVGGAFAEALAGASMQHFNDKHIWESTLIAQVLVECDEIFSVTDLRTNQVIQGHADGKIRRVSHLVRLENKMETHFPENAARSSAHYVGSWQITDWDDLLDGNLWYL